ncbi:hypothetical protein GIB67_015475 [Kingdonia uniflora]|uniref:Uncharacterized protein n=1 Tax=Kingdonia uniflora TaxID=39325 RepID=A0A7J7LAD6_9MAGN|nr:hypothetical protein GIB67_015475 [Kingdonia uniflora]
MADSVKAPSDPKEVLKSFLSKSFRSRGTPFKTSAVKCILFPVRSYKREREDGRE